MNFLKEHFDKILKVYLLISVVGLSAVSFFLFRSVDSLKKEAGYQTNSTLSVGEDVGSTLLPTSEVSSSQSDSCGEACKKEIEKAVSEALVEFSLAPLPANSANPTAAPKTSSPTKTQLAYIPLGGPITTTSTSWVDAAGTDFWMDLVGEYGKNAKATWEGSLKVAHSNGQAYARILDVTHGTAVTGSEISVTNQGTLTSLSSGDLSVWAGRNQYRVQLKSLNSFEVTFGSGKVRISY